MPDQKLSADPVNSDPSTSATLAGIDPGIDATKNYRFSASGVKKWLATTVSDLVATGTRSATTFLRGDGTWAVAAGGGTGVSDGYRNTLASPYSAIGDGTMHPLSERFATLAEAQAVYPFCTALTESIDWAAIQKAINDAEGQSVGVGGAVLIPNTGNKYILNRGLTWNSNRSTIKGNGTALHWPSLASSEPGITVNADTGFQYGHSKNVFEGFRFEGPGDGRGAVTNPCFYFNTNVDSLSSRCMVRDFDIYNWRIGILYKDRSYMTRFNHGHIYYCYECVNFPWSSTEYQQLTDSGEMLSFTDVTFMNSTTAVMNVGRSEMIFTNCSFDYCNQIFKQNNGEITLNGCHIELQPPSVPVIECWGGHFTMHGGVVLISDPSNVGTTATHIFEVAETYAWIRFWGVNGYNWRSTGAMVQGSGSFTYDGTAMTTMPSFISHP